MPSKAARTHLQIRVPLSLVTLISPTQNITIRPRRPPTIAMHPDHLRNIICSLQQTSSTVPPPSVDATRKRTHNQLGLTPLTEEHESSEEEDDVDEETKLSQTVSTGELKFTYKGQTSTLQTPTDIATWIEERKKRYPTRARVEERLREAEAKKQAAKETREAKRAKENATRQQKNMDQEEAGRPLKEARMKKDKYKSDKIALKEEQKQPLDPADAAAKAKLKAEKLRRKLIKEEKRVARAEADAEKARLRAEASKAHTNGVLDGEAKPPVTPTSAAEYAPSSASCDTSKPALTEIEDTQPDDQIDAGGPQQEQPEQPTSHLESIIHTDEVQAAITGPATILTQQETPNTMEHTPHVNGNAPPTAVTGNGLSDELDSLSSFSDNDSELDDETSSSGSDSSEEEGDTSSSEPEQATTRREQPDGVDSSIRPRTKRKMQ
ncbi:CCCH zinc finger protein [Histoplasma capsulatum]|uniref:CCCH zinc finger protein n=1 Tax=Ajellomyces capsulatus TaxID=5037 RepID=A0A8A1MLY6_AJECA|nr:CCCH zinc finger protein [Histoplasma capsulatum]